MRKIVLVALLALSLVPAILRAETFTFTVVGIDCEHCVPPLLKALRAVPGVGSPAVEWKRGEVRVEIPEGFDKQKLRTAVAKLGYEAFFPGETAKGLEPLAKEIVATLDIVEHRDGKRIDIARLVAPGKITVVDFWAEWCSPCKIVEARLHQAMAANPDIALRRVDIAKWDNDAARQLSNEFRAEAIPYLRVYDAKGKFVGSVTGGNWDAIRDLIAKAER